jgi:hypothetical protein
MHNLIIAYVNLSFDLVRRRIDQRDRIGTYRNDGECLSIGRVSQPVYQQFTSVERAESAGHRIAKPDHAEQSVAGRVDDRNRIRGLVRRVHAVVAGDGNIGSPPQSLLCIGIDRKHKEHQHERFFHAIPPD